MSADRLVPKSHGRPIARQAGSAAPCSQLPGRHQASLFPAHAITAPSDLRRSVIHDQVLKITSGPDGSVYSDDEVRLLRNRFARQRVRPGDARTHEHGTRRADCKTPLGTAPGDGR